MAGTANSITSHNSLRGVLNANNVVAGGVGTSFDSTYSVIAETGAQIALSISSTDYKMQATLKDKYGNIIYTSNIIDLPLETMVVNARYDKNTKEVVLILDNGNELRFSVADLVEGLVSTDQLNSVLTDYVKFTDYATSAKSGTIKSGVSSFAVNNQGQPYALEVAYNNYSNMENTSFISKGTLESVIAGKELVNKTYVDEADAVFEDKLFGDNSIEGSGTELTIDNTIKAPMNLTYKGNTYQYSTSGINLFDNSNSIWIGASAGKVNYDENNDTFTFHRDGGGDYLVGKGKFNLKANTAYSIYINVVSNTMTNTMRTGGSNLSLPISIPAGATGKYVFSGTSNSDLSLNYDLWLYCPNTNGTFEAQLMLVEGTYTLATIPSYEPYTNGASPNPDYPQDIHVVSGNNTVDIHKNFFDGKIEQGSFKTEDGTLIDSTIRVRSTNYINVDKDTYIFDLKNNSNYYIVIYVYDENNNYISSESTLNWVVLPFTKSFNNKRKVKIGIRYVNNATITPTDVEQIIVNSSNDLRQYPINLGSIELCKIGTYQDKIDKSTGKNLVFSTLSQHSINSSGVILSGQPSFDMNIAKVVQGKTYTITTDDGGGGFVGGFFTNIPANGSVSYNNTRIVQDNKTFTAPITGYVAFRSSTGYATPMLNEGQTALPYEPYGTGWYLKKEIGKKDNLLSDFVSVYTNYSNLDYIRFLKPNDSATKGNATNIPALLTCGRYAMNYNFNDATYINKFSPNGEYTVFWFGVTKGTTTEQAQTILTDSTLYYPLAIPTYTLIEDATLINQLETIKNSYEGQTNISQTNNDLPFELNISAVSGNLSGIKLLLEAKEDKSNKVAVINEYSTDEQYPTAKCVYELVGNVESILEILDIGDGVYAGGESA